MSESSLKQLYKSESGIIQELYQGVSNGDSWEPFMQKLITAMDARSARVLVMNPRADKVYKSFSVNHDAHFLLQYTDYYVNKCPWRPELSQKPRGLLYSTFLDFSCKQTEFRQTEFYNDWAKLQNIEHGICGTVVQDQDKTIQLLVQRTKEAGHFTRDEVAFVNGLVPHIRNTVTLTENMEAMEAVKAGVAELSDGYSQPFALVNEKMKLCFISQRMEENLNLNPGLSLISNQLIVRDARQNARLEKLLHDCILSAKGMGRSAGGALDIRTNGNDVQRLRIMPFPVYSNKLFFSSQYAFAVIFLSTLSVNSLISKEQLAKRYSLTDREQELALKLCEGLSLDQIAELDGVKTSTVRKQLKSIYLKTGTHRQGELIVRLLNGFSSLRN